MAIGAARHHRKLSPVLAALLGAGVLLSLAPAALAQDPGGNTGTIKVHDDEVVDPPQRNQPHVSGDVWVQGFKMSGDSGWLIFTSIPPTSNPPEVVLNASWTGTPDDPFGFTFNAGPFNLPCGHYRVEAFTDEGGHKQKVFWVEGCVPEEERPECPPADITATANADGTVTLTWTEVDDEDVLGYNVFREDSEGDLELIAVVDAGTTTFTDTTTEIGVTYTYTVASFTEDLESELCAEAEVTVIPDLPSLMALGGATLGGVAAYAWRRRK